MRYVPAVVALVEGQAASTAPPAPSPGMRGLFPPSRAGGPLSSQRDGHLQGV